MIVGDPVTLCTTGYNTQCWIEMIKLCVESNSFKYQCAHLFEKFLDTKVLSRRMLEKQHGEFIKKSLAPPVSQAQSNKV